MTGGNVLGTSAPLRIRNFYSSVLNFHVRELFAVLVAVTSVPFAVTQIPFGSVRCADGVGSANLVGMPLHRADDHGMETPAEQSHFARSANSVDGRAFVDRQRRGWSQLYRAVVDQSDCHRRVRLSDDFVVKLNRQIGNYLDVRCSAL